MHFISTTDVFCHEKLLSIASKPCVCHTYHLLVHVAVSYESLACLALSSSICAITMQSLHSSALNSHFCIDGCCAARRIAARLLAKRGGMFREKLEVTTGALIKLSAHEPKGSDPAVVEAAVRRDALQGLGRLCAAAAQQNADNLLTSAVEHLLR